jgi:hypothetical protein
MIERKAYVCEHCNKHRKMKKTVYLTRSVAWSHECSCIYNPKNRACCTCKHNIFEDGIRVNICDIGKGISEAEQLERISQMDRITKCCEFWESEVEG